MEDDTPTRVEDLWFSDINAVLAITAYGEHPAALSPEDRILFLKGSLQLTRQTHCILNSFLDTPDVVPGCEHGDTCSSVRKRVFLNIQREMYNDSTETESLELANDYKSAINASECCFACHRLTEEKCEQRRAELWEKLPSLFGLAPWKELEKMKEAALIL